MAPRPMRVMLLIDSFQMGGAERITAAILPHLDRSRVAPVICTLRTRGDSPLAQKLGDIPRFDLRAKRMLDPVALQRLVRYIRQQKIDLIHAQLQDSTVWAVAAQKITGVPVIVTRHLIGDDGSTWRRRLRNQLERFVIRNGVTRVITVSDAARDYYARLARIPLARFQTIYNGIDLENFARIEDETTKNALRQQLGLPIGEPLIAMVGVLRSGKGQEVASCYRSGPAFNMRQNSPGRRWRPTHRT
jgi:glycosyltransferase involved in cell wall biosynthesis